MTAEARQRKALAWLRFAYQDLRHARKVLNLSDDTEPYHVAFWAQQAAEKALKAALSFTGSPIDPTHDLDRLAALLPAGWQARMVIGNLGELSTYAVDSRYPEAFAPPTIDDARRAVRQATAIYQSIYRDLRDHGLPLS